MSSWELKRTLKSGQAGTQQGRATVGRKANLGAGLTGRQVLGSHHPLPASEGELCRCGWPTAPKGQDS